MMEAEDIENMIRAAIPDAWIEVDDLRGNGIHYSVFVESSMFAGKSLIDQHRMIFEALKGNVGSSIATLTLKTRVPREYMQA